ncbi:MAG TPA: alpha/beta fold hydrolase [Acidimicrobiales bacterium]|nr:alpha/beta fold hydrolase [Acidimicrobiales bacterium]
MPEVDVGDLRVHHQRLGSPEGETVVLLHGMLVDNLSSLYLTLAPVLVGAGMDVLLYDQRGHGRTRRTAEGYTIDGAVADLIGLLDVLGIDEPVHLLGNSYGALIAIEAALAHPERVQGLVLVEAHFAVEGWGDNVAHDLELAGFGLGEADVQQWLDEFGGRKLNRLARKVEALIYDTTIIEDLRAARPLPPEALRALDLPVMSIYGEHSDAIERARDLQALLPRLEMNLFQDCAHSVLFEATRTVRGVVADWFARVGAGDEIVSRSTKVAVGEQEGEGEEHQEHVDFYKAELERRMGSAAAGTALRIAPKLAGGAATGTAGGDATASGPAGAG